MSYMSYMGYTSQGRLREIIRVIRGYAGLYEVVQVIFKLSESELRSYKLSYTCRVIYIREWSHMGVIV